MKRKYRKEKAIMVDLRDRKNIKIIEAEKITYSDYDIEVLRQQVDDKTKAIEEFNNYLIRKEIESRRSISDEEFDSAMKDLLRQHKMLKYLLEEQG